MVLAEEARQMVYVPFHETCDNRLLACAFRLRLAPVPVPEKGLCIRSVKNVSRGPNEKENRRHVLTECAACVRRDVEAEDISMRDGGKGPGNKSHGSRREIKEAQNT